MALPRERGSSKSEWLERCERPQPWLNTETGEVTYGRCHARTRDRCRYCAGIHEGDLKNMARSGLGQHMNQGQPTYLVTFTPPSFWRTDAPTELRKTHRFYRRYWELLKSGRPSRRAIRDAARRAVCGWCTSERRREFKSQGIPSRKVKAVRHGPDDPLAGLPVYLDAFDYEAAVAWAWRLGDLWHRTTTYFDRVHAKTEYFKALEYQRRGVPHIHDLLSGPDLTEKNIRDAIDQVSGSVPEGHGWGEQLDIQRLDTKSDTGRTAAAATNYVAKYATKDSAVSLADHAASHPHAKEHFRRLRLAAQKHVARHAAIQPGSDCPKEECSGRLMPDHPDSRRLHCTNYQDPEHPGTGRHFDNTQRYVNQLGVRSNRTSKSRHWAHEYRRSRVDPDVFKRVVHKNGEPIPLTLGRIYHRRRVWYRKHHPQEKTEVTLKWIPRSSSHNLATRSPPS